MTNSFSKTKNPVEDDQASQRNKAPWLQDNISKRERQRRKRVALNEIEKVQKLIKTCMHMCMTRDEAMEALRIHEKIDPEFTKLVWESLEELNPKVFKAYYNLIGELGISVAGQTLNRASFNVSQANSNSSNSGLENPGSDGNVTGSANYFYSPAVSVETPQAPGNEIIRSDLPMDSR